MEKLPEQSKEKEAQPPLLFAKAAQKIYYAPEKASEIADDLRDKLHIHYEYMRSHGTEAAINKARYLELRGPWNALLAPIVHAIEIELLKELRPYKNIDDPSALLPAGEYDQLPLDTHEDGARATLTIMEYWVTQVTTWFVEEIEADPNHWCQPIVETFGVYHPLFCEAESPQKNGWQRQPNLLSAILEFSLDSNITACIAAGSLAEHHKRYDSIWEDRNQTGLMIERAKELSWAASVTRKLLGDYLGREEEGQISKGCPFAPPGFDHLWVLPSLENGPWLVHRYCPANPQLIPRTLEERVIVRHALNDQPTGLFARDYYPDGVRTAEMRLNMLIRVMGKIVLNEYIPLYPPLMGANCHDIATSGGYRQPKATSTLFPANSFKGKCDPGNKAATGV